jgi:hypothetical protein
MILNQPPVDGLPDDFLSGGLGFGEEVELHQTAQGT